MTARLGEVAGVGDVELEDLTAAWTADQWAGYWLVPNWNTTRIFRIAGNSAQKLIIVKDTNGEGLLSVTSRRSLYAILTDSDARRYVALTKDGEDYTPIDTRLLYYFEGVVKHVQYGWVGSGASALIPPAAPNRFLDRYAYDSVLIPDHVSYMTGSTFYVLVSGDTMSTADFAFSRDKFVKDAVAVTDAVTPLIKTNYFRIVVGDTIAITENIPPMVTVPYIWWAAGNGDLMRLTTTRSAYSSITMKDENTPAPTGISNNVWEMAWGDAFCYSAKDRLFYGIGGGLQINNIRSISAWDPALRAMRPGELVAPGYPAAAFTPSAGQLQADAAGNLWHVSGNTGNPTQHFLAKNVPGNIDTVSTSTYPHPSISGRFWDPRALLYDAVLDRLFFIATIFSGVNFIFRIDPANPSAIEGQSSTTAGFQGDLVMRRPNASPSTSEIITVDGNTTVQRMTATGIMTLQATATLAGASLYSVTYDPTRDEIWAGSQFEGKVYRLNGSTLAVLSSITLASSRRPAKLIYEPASSGPYGVSGDRVWVIPDSFSVTSGEALSINPANPTVIESVVNPATSPVSTQGNVVTAMRPVYTSPRLGLPAVASPTNAGASLLRPEAWPLPGAVTNQGSIIAGHWRAGSHNDIDAATNRVNRIRDLSGNGKHFTPKDGLNAKRCLHVANEATANNPCFSFAKDAHMVAEGGWTMADLIYNSAIANPFDKDEFLWFIVYRRHATPVGFEVLFGAFTTTAQELGIVNRSGSGNDAWLGFYNGANANVTSTRAQVGGTIGGRVLGGWMGANFVTNPPIYGSVDQATDNSDVTTTGALPLTGVPEIGNTTNGSFTALDADIYEIFCLRRANTVRFLGPKFFTHYARAKYGMT